MSDGERQFRQGEHICAIYDRPDEQYEVAAAYIADGLQCRERCLYAAESEVELDILRAALRDRGVAPVSEEASGALLMQTSRETHLAGGGFDPERMLAMLNDAVESALDAGFTGLRTCGDMSWLLGDPPGAEGVVEYEGLLNTFFHNVRALGMCQYNRARLPARALDHALATHPTVIVSGGLVSNVFYRPPSISATRTGQPTDVPWKIRELRRRATAAR